VAINFKRSWNNEISVMTINNENKIDSSVREHSILRKPWIFLACLNLQISMGQMKYISPLNYRPNNKGAVMG
jgi:hypothetical protein